MSQRLALLIGMTAYPDDRLEATATNADMRALVDLLRSPENGRFDRVVPLMDQTAVALQLGIASFFEQSLTPDDLILFYFAGHSLIHHQNIYLAAADTFTEEYLDATTVEIDFIRRRLTACPAKQVILFDCGFSLIGATDRHTQGHEMLVEALQGDNRAVLTGAGLTIPLTAGLHGAADTNQDGVVTFAELRAYLTETLPAETAVFSTTIEETDIFPLLVNKTAAVTAVPPPISPLPPTSAAGESGSGRQRYGFAALALLLLIVAFGFYAVSSGLFAQGGAGDGPASPTSTSTTLPNATALTNTAELDPATATQTPPASETAVSTTAPSATATRQASPTAAVTRTPSPTATLSATPSPTPSPTSSPTHTRTPRPTATPAPTGTPTTAPTSTPVSTSAPVPMTIVARQAFLRAGPGTNYRILAFPLQGTAVTIIGRNREATWYNAVLEDGSRGWLYRDVIAPDGSGDFDDIAIAATIPAPIDDFYDPVVTSAPDSLSVQVAHTYVGTQGDNALFRARLLPLTDLVQPTYPNGQDLGLGLLTVVFNRVGDGAFTSEQVELCMVTEAGEPFYCETVFFRKSW